MTLSATHKPHRTDRPVSTTDTRPTLSTTDTNQSPADTPQSTRGSAQEKKGMRGDGPSQSSGHSPIGSVPISFSLQLCRGTRRLIPQDGREDLLRQLKPRKPLACSPREIDRHWSRGSPLPSLPSARRTFHAKGPRAWPGGRRGDPAGGAHKTPRLRSASRPRAVLRGLQPSRLLTAARDKRHPTEGSVQPAGLTGLGQSLRPLSAAARHRGRGPGSRHGAGHATATDASARPAAQPPRRRRRAFPTIMLRSAAAAAAAAAPGPPSGAASFPPPGASRASAGDGRGGRGGRRPPPPPPRHLLPPPRLPPLALRGGLGARGAPCWRRLSPQKMPQRAPGRSLARRPGRRAPAGGLDRGAHSLARSLTHSPRLLSPTAARGLRGCRRRPEGES